MGAVPTPDRASEATYKLMAFLGMKVKVPVNRRRAGRIIDQLKQRVAPPVVASTNRLADEDWEPQPPTDKQIWKLGQLRVPRDVAGIRLGRQSDYRRCREPRRI